MDLRIYPSKTLVLKGCERPLPWISADLSGFNLVLPWLVSLTKAFFGRCGFPFCQLLTKALTNIALINY
jgi:hypothetical protein